MFLPGGFILVRSLLPVAPRSTLIPQSDSGEDRSPHRVDQSRAPNSVGRSAFVEKPILLDILGETD